MKFVNDRKTTKKGKERGKMKTRKKKGRFNFRHAVLLIGYIPLLTANIILTIFASHTMETNLEESTFSRLEACAISVKQYFLWNINAGILERNDNNNDFIDSMKEKDIELTFFEGDTRFITSIKDENGNWNVNNRKSPICDKKSHPRILGISCKWCNSLGTL